MFFLVTAITVTYMRVILCFHNLGKARFLVSKSMTSTVHKAQSQHMATNSCSDVSLVRYHYKTGY